MQRAIVTGLWSILAPVVCFSTAALAAPPQGEAAGERLAKQVYHRADGNDMSSVGKMVLKVQDQQPRVRELYSYRLESKGGAIHSLIRFTAPADIRGTGLLTVDQPDGSSDQWVYLPALDRSRRISANRKGGRFVGSDIYYEDLRDRKVSMDRHRLLRQEKISGMPTQVLESTPVKPDNSTYGKRISWIHTPSLLPIRIDFYARGRDKRPVKRMEVHRIEKIQGYWTIMDSLFTDLSSGHQTRMIMEKVVYDRDLPASLFTNQALEDPARERVYRP